MSTPERLERILRIELPASVTVAEKTLPLGQVLQFAVGTLIAFEKKVDDRFELRIQDRTIAVGEAVKVGGRFGLHVQEVGAMQETIRSLGPA